MRNARHDEPVMRSVFAGFCWTFCDDTVHDDDDDDATVVAVDVVG